VNKKVSNENYGQTILEELLETMIFDQERLDDLKQNIIKLELGDISKEDVWRELISHKAKLLENILKRLPSVIEIVSHPQNPKNDLKAEHNEDLLRKLKERENLLEMVAKKIQFLSS
jgi:hypothetical protein